MSSIVFARPIAGSSPTLPAGLTSRPIHISPLRNVPAVRIVLSAVILSPFPKKESNHTKPSQADANQNNKQ